MNGHDSRPESAFEPSAAAEHNAEGVEQNHAPGTELHAAAVEAPGSAAADGKGVVGELKVVRFVAAGLILRHGQILICQRRADQPMAHKWEFPGGKIEAGETPEQALKRELEEELGIDARIGTRVHRMRHTYRSGGAVDLQFFLVREFVGEMTNNIFQTIEWCALKDLPRYDFLAADRSLVRDLAAGKLL